MELTFVMRTADSKIWSYGQYRLYEAISGTGWMIADDSGWYDGEWPSALDAIASTMIETEPPVTMTTESLLEAIVEAKDRYRNASGNQCGSHGGHIS